MNRIEIVGGDITRIEVDAIVNAANSALAGGGGVDGAIHRTAGPGLLEECRQIGGCATGSAVVTRAFNLPAKFVIHAVGPIWRGGESGEPELLASCYRRSLELAVEKQARRVSLPAISCGVYRFPIPMAAKIAVAEVVAFLASDSYLKSVLMVCFDAEVRASYERALAGLT